MSLTKIYKVVEVKKIKDLETELNNLEDGTFQVRLIFSNDKANKFVLIAES